MWLRNSQSYKGDRMANEKMCAVSISEKALSLAKKERSLRLKNKGVKLTIGAVVSEAVFEAYGKNA